MKIPKKYQTSDYSFDKNDILINKLTKEPVIKNSRSAGTERSIKISGQDFWSGVNCHIRSKISKELKKFFYEILRDIPKIDDCDYPIGIELDIYDVIEGNQDIDNLTYIYRKTLHDALAGNIEFIKDENGKFHPDKDKYPAIISDDSLQYVQQISSRFYPIEDHNNNLMIIKLYKL